MSQPGGGAEAAAVDEARRLAEALERLLAGDAAGALASCQDGPPSQGARQMERWRARQVLEELRERESLTGAEVRAAEAGLDLTPYPDLERAFARLRAAAEAGPALEALAADPSLDRRLLLGLRVLLPVDPAVAAALRARVLDQETDDMWEGAAQLTALVLARELPQVARLEGPFLRSALIRDAADKRWQVIALGAVLLYALGRWAWMVRSAWLE